MIAGIFSFNRPIAHWVDPLQMATAMAPFQAKQGLRCWNTEGFLLLQVPVSSGPQAAGMASHAASGVAVAFWGRLDNRPELNARLNLDSQTSDAETVAMAWLKWREHCPEHLLGDFSLAIAQPSERLFFLARDIMGVKPLLYRLDAEGVVFANTLAAFKPLRLGALTPSRRWMAKYLADISYHDTETAYTEVKKLPPAHSLLITGNGKSVLRKYHAFDPQAPQASQADPKYLEAYRAVWQQAVACRVPSTGKIGCENSGGLDSGSITAEVARQLGPDIGRLHGMGFCYEALEPEYIRATAEQWGIQHQLLFNEDTGADDEHILQRVLAVNGAPQEHPNGYAHYPFYRYCVQNNIHHLLSGFGGDEAVTYPGGIPARLELMDLGQWPALWQRLPGSAPMRIGRLLKTVRSGLHMPSHNTGFMKSWKARWRHHFFDQQAFDEFNIEQAYFATATYDERFRSVNAAVAYLIQRPMLATRLENCSIMAASYGIDYAWPLLDSRLIQQYLHTPVHWKTGPQGISRYLHRRAVSGVCPDKVAWKSNKDMGYAAGAEKVKAGDNRALFQQALQLASALPAELQGICDVTRVKQMAQRALKEDWRGLDVQIAWSTNIYQWRNLSEWLSSARKIRD